MLGTNLSGDIKFDIKGIARKYDPYLMFNFETYKPDISKSIFNSNIMQLNKNLIQLTDNENLVLCQNQLYYYVSDKKDIWLYNVKKVD